MDLQKTIEANQIALQIQDVDIQAFVLKNQKKYSSDLLRLIAEQAIARQKAKSKIPTWFADSKIIFPTPLSVEQASSEITAEYKSRIIPQDTHGIDLTGGMGIDIFYFAKLSKSVIYLEKNEELTNIATYNFAQKKIINIACKNEDSITFLENTTTKFDWIYLDPHRRDSSKNKVFRIEDCEPNFLKIKDLLFDKTSKILIKFSPLLDLKLAASQLENVVEMHVVSVENEVKELLFLCDKNSVISLNEIPISCVNLSSSKPNQFFKFSFEKEEKTNITYSLPINYIYEPNASILKAGAFKAISEHFKIKKIAPNSHLYTSENLIENFAGRSFKIIAVCKFDKKEIQSYLTDNQANISTRNFPMKPEEIKKKLGLHDGGNIYLFATETFEKKKIVILCEKV